MLTHAHTHARRNARTHAHAQVQWQHRALQPTDPWISLVDHNILADNASAAADGLMLYGGAGDKVPPAAADKASAIADGIALARHA